MSDEGISTVTSSATASNETSLADLVQLADDFVAFFVDDLKTGWNFYFDIGAAATEYPAFAAVLAVTWGRVGMTIIC